MNYASTFSIREHEDQGCRFRRIRGGGLRAALEITGRCNLHCRHCFARLEDAELTTAQWLAILEQLPGIDARKIILTGGEPLLRMDVEILIRAASTLKMGVDLNTNMSPLTPGRAGRLFDSGLREISTSIDGGPEYHDWFRQAPGDFGRVLKGVKLAARLGFEVDIHGACTPGNLSQIENVIDRCAEAGAASFTLFAVVSRGRGKAQLADERFSLGTQDVLILGEIIQKVRQKYGERFPIRTVDIFNHPTCEECSMGEAVVGISPGGMLVPCLLAEYTPREDEDLTRSPLAAAFQSMQARVRRDGRAFECSNTTGQAQDTEGAL